MSITKILLINSTLSGNANILNALITVNPFGTITSINPDYSSGGYSDILCPADAFNIYASADNQYPVTSNGFNFMWGNLMDYLNSQSSSVGSDGTNLYSTGGGGFELRNTYVNPILASTYNYSIQFIDPPTLCFFADSEILTARGQLRIDEMLTTDLVVLSDFNFKKVDTIKKSKVVHVHSAPILYQHSRTKLTVTRNHSLLFNDFESEEQKEKVIKEMGYVHVTDSMVRVPAFLARDMHAYPSYGVFDVYHLALENEDLDANHAIFANNILVETCQLSQINRMV